MRDYIVVPEGYSPDNIPRGKLVELHTVGPDEDNAEIVILEDGIVPEYIPPIVYRKKLADELGAELPKVKVAKEVQGKTKTEVLGRREQKPDLRKGMPPLPQFILVHELGWERVTSIDEIVESLEEIKWFESIDFDIRKNVVSCLEYLSGKKLAYYNDEEKVAHLTPKSSDEESLAEAMDLADEGYSIEEGPYPVVKLIRDILSQNVSMRRGEIARKVYSDWRWTRSKKAFDKWLKRSVDLGHVKETPSGKYEPHRAI